MTIDQRIDAFSGLGNELANLSHEAIKDLADKAGGENPWFTASSVSTALHGLGNFLDKKHLDSWTSSYRFTPYTSKTVAIIMAGNIPLVGFHDLLSVLISGHRAKVKLSSKDTVLMKYVIDLVIKLEPSFESSIQIVEDRLTDFDAVIATGSDNSARYFDYYFGKYPNIIRKNRSSCAILTGDESEIDLKNLGTDVFTYFGLGCRNASKVYSPQGFDITKLLDAWPEFSHLVHHHKYCNNYDYQRSILLVNSVKFLDSGYVILQENDRLVSPISVVYYENYENDSKLKEQLSGNREKIQCIVGNHALATTKFGQSQLPALADYADQRDTLSFLTNLN